MRILFLCQKFRTENFFARPLVKKYILNKVFSVETFFEKFYSFSYDLVVIDSSIEKFNSDKILTEIYAEQPGLPVIFLMRDYSNDVLNQFITMQLSAIIHFKDSPKIESLARKLNFGNLNFDFAHNSFFLRDKALDLPRREFLLLNKLFFNRHQFLSRTDISKFLLKDCIAVNSNMIDVYVYRLRKLLRQNSPELKIKYHRHLGYKIAHCNPP